jgi:hypothetical protein
MYDQAGGSERARGQHRSKIEAGIVMPADWVASYFTTTVVPIGTRL